MWELKKDNLIYVPCTNAQSCQKIPLELFCFQWAAILANTLSFIALFVITELHHSTLCDTVLLLLLLTYLLCSTSIVHKQFLYIIPFFASFFWLKCNSLKTQDVLAWEKPRKLASSFWWTGIIFFDAHLHTSFKVTWIIFSMNRQNANYTGASDQGQTVY